ncbi:MAG: HAD family hydrolase [Alphaproteobacteria bacterium]
MSGIAIFDLDRTLTKRSCFTPFILYVAIRRPRRLLSFHRIILAALCNIVGLYKRDDIKLLMWREVLGGLPREEAEDLGNTFAKIWIQNELRRQTKKNIKKHQEAGDRLILATAAMDIIADPIGRTLGFNDIISTRTHWTAEGCVSGNFDGRNCYGEEKLRRVKLILGDLAPSKTLAYSDHITDLPVLLWAENGIVINPHRPLRDAAGRHGLHIEDWD